MLLRARRAALVAVGPRLWKCTAPAGGLSSFARARGTTCKLRSPMSSKRRVSRGAGTPALAVSGDEVKHSSLLRTRAVLRWLWSAHASRKGTAPTRCLFSSARARGATCKLRSATPSQRRVSCAAQAHLRSLSLGRRRSTRPCCAHAPCRADCVQPMPYASAKRQREACFLRRTPVMRRKSNGPQRQASVACLARRRCT